MVQVRYDPFKEIVILDKVKYSLEDFIRAMGIVSASAVASWAEGIVFTYHVLPWSESTIKEAVNGRLYWSHVAYSELPSFRQVLESKDGRIRIGVIDVSSSETLTRVAKWIKVLERLPKAWERREEARAKLRKTAL